MAELREVSILIGKRNYFIQTELDDDTLGRVAGIVKDACDSISGSVDQDGLLTLVCLQLAYNVEKISGLLEPVGRKLDEFTDM